MTKLPQIQLDHDWWYLFAERQRDDYSATGPEEAAWLPLAQLSDWAVTQSAHGGADWFRHTFTLHATDYCVRYNLLIDDLPKSVDIYINGQRVVQQTTSASFSKDVTDYIHLGENELAIKLTTARGASANTGGSTGGTFGTVCLQPSRCD